MKSRILLDVSRHCGGSVYVFTHPYILMVM